MSDEIESAGDVKPKRKYTRRNITGIDQVDDIANNFMERFIDENVPEDADAEVGVEFDGEILDGITPDESKEVKFLGQEPVNNSLKAKMERALGINCQMELKPWRGLDHWRCKKCGWDTFKADMAKNHRC